MVIGSFRDRSILIAISFASFVIAVWLIPTLEKWVARVELLSEGFLLKLGTWIAAYVLAFHVLPWILDRAYMMIFEG